MKMRPPATPILNIDPYFSVWTENSVLENTVHWTGKPNTIVGTVTIDGAPFHFLGENANNYPAMTVENTEINTFSTIITYKNDAVRFTAHFTSPLLVEDLYYTSRPVAYCKTSFESIDGNEHTVSVTFSVSEELVMEIKGDDKVVTEVVDIPDVTAIKMGRENQKLLWRDGDDIRIDWGYFYLCVKGEGEVNTGSVSDMSAINVTAKLENEALFLFGYDDIYSIQYFGENLKAYWKKDGKTINEVLTEAANDYNCLLERCDAFSAKIKAEAEARGNEKYAELLMLAYRQVMAAHKLVVDNEGNNLYISKECNSNGCAATVDVTYPSAPLYLLFNTELLKGMLRPVMRYAATEEWTFDFAPHDAGRYPLVNGMVYGTDRNADGTVVIHDEWHMPVEECGNMITLFAAICDVDDNTDFVKPYMETVKQWSRYLIKYGADPENQLCTDDFAGHLAHNVNLSIKAIMGIAGYSRILSRLGETDEAEKMMAIARDYAKGLVEKAANSDGSFRLAYDKPETFSLKYNSVWDKIWGTNLFPKEFYEGEIARYKKELLPYGVPLDSREKYTKSDWLVWAASLAENKEDFCILVDSLWEAYNTMETRVAMTDWYYCTTSNMREFRHRTVQGGLFIKFMFN